MEKLTLEEKVMPEKKNKLFNSISNFISKNKENIIFGVIGAVSIPAAHIYKEKGEDITSKILSGAFGTAISIGLVYGVYHIQTSDIAKYNTPKVEIAQKYNYNPSNYVKSNNVALSDILLLAGTNYYLFETLSNSPKNKITTVVIKANDKKDSVECIYSFDGFKKPEEINLIENKPQIELNKKVINGNLGLDAYSGLCKQIFEEEKKYF